MTRDAAQAVGYAQSIGLDSVYTEALQALEQWQQAERTVIATRHTRRQLEEQLEDREMEVASIERAANPDMSATAFKEHIRGPLRSDSASRELRSQLTEAQWQLDCAMLTSDDAKLTLRIKSARLNELGGYLTYLAAVRVASLQSGQSDNTGQSEGTQSP